MEEIPEFRIDEVPNTTRWRFVPLYKESITGAMLSWQVGFDGINELEMIHGQVPNNRTDRTEVVPMSNRTMKEQAIQMARQKYKEKYTQEGYRPAGVQEEPLKDCMKGRKYSQGMIKRWPVVVQTKIDGIRLLVSYEGNKFILRSRLNTQYTHLGHLEKQLAEYFQYLPSYITLDGEMYIHGEFFEELASIIKSVVNIHPRISEIEYHIFDMNYDAPFEDRYNILVNAYKRAVEDGVDFSRINLVRSFLAYSHQEIIEYHDVFVALDYEGIMIKKISGGSCNFREIAEANYKPGRTANILKHKNFIDEEGEIVGVEEAKGTEKGCAVIVVQDAKGNIFNVRTKGSFERRRCWLQNSHELIGKLMTYRYQELTIHGIPRFPIGIAIRDYE